MNISKHWGEIEDAANRLSSFTSEDPRSIAFAAQIRASTAELVSENQRLNIKNDLLEREKAGLIAEVLRQKNLLNAVRADAFSRIEKLGRKLAVQQEIIDGAGAIASLSLAEFAKLGDVTAGQLRSIRRGDE